MASTLNEAFSLYDDYNSTRTIQSSGIIDDIFMIDANDREILVPDREMLFGVYHDKDAERKYFQCPRYVGDNIDLSQCHIFVNYISVGGKVGQYLCDDINVDTANITFSWLLSGNLFDENKDGFVWFAIMAKQADEKGVLKTVFNTKKAKGIVAEGIQADDVIIEEYADIIFQILSKLDGIENDIGEEVRKYLSENPLEGLDETQLLNYLTRNNYAKKSDIPTQTTVTNWGFTKNTGTYSKPSGGIPENDLSNEVKTKLNKESLSEENILQKIDESNMNSTDKVPSMNALTELLVPYFLNIEQVAGANISEFVTGIAMKSCEKIVTEKGLDFSKSYVEEMLIFSDDFEGNSLNRGLWTREIGTKYNNELQYYTPEQVVVNNGLTLIADKINNEEHANLIGAEYISGRINSAYKLHARYGKVTARIKTPSVKSAWPAFWLLGTGSDMQWPQCGEIDIMEQINDDMKTRTNYHSYDIVDGVVQVHGYQGSITSITPHIYHDYTLIWNENKMSYYVDDVKVHEKNMSELSHPEIFDEPFYIILNLAVGGWASVPDNTVTFPYEMNVSNVSVYKYIPVIKPVGKPFVSVQEKENRVALGFPFNQPRGLENKKSLYSKGGRIYFRPIYEYISAIFLMLESQMDYDSALEAIKPTIDEYIREGTLKEFEDIKMQEISRQLAEKEDNKIWIEFLNSSQFGVNIIIGITSESTGDNLYLQLVASIEMEGITKDMFPIQSYSIKDE